MGCINQFSSRLIFQWKQQGEGVFSTDIQEDGKNTYFQHSATFSLLFSHRGFDIF